MTPGSVGVQSHLYNIRKYSDYLMLSTCGLSRRKTPIKSTLIGIFLIAVPTTAFLLFFDPKILNPNNSRWLFIGDWAQHFLGAQAFLTDTWHFPLGMTRLLSWPTGVSIIYTDSNPLIALPAKLVSRWLPEGIQWIGPWFLLCLILQYGFGCRIARALGYGEWTAMLAGVVFLLPPTLYFRIGHDTLVAHWIILWAILIFLRPEGRNRACWSYALNFGVAVLVHAYLLLMAAGIWAAEALSEAFRAVRDTRWRESIRPLVMLAAIPPSVALAIMGFVGYFDGSQSGEHGFGVFSMNLNAPFNPADPAISRLLPARPMAVGQYEGFQYLGAGLLLLLGVAVCRRALVFAFFVAHSVSRGNSGCSASAAGLHMPKSRGLPNPLIKAGSLALIASGFALFSLSHIVRFDQNVVATVLTAPDDVIDHWLGTFRATGRFFWVPLYLLLSFSLWGIREFRPPIPAILLSICILLQAVDLSPFPKRVRARTETASELPSLPTHDPVWDRLMGSATVLEFYPSEIDSENPRLLDSFYHIANFSTRVGIPITAAYLARRNAANSTAWNKLEHEFSHGIKNPEHLYVLTNPCVIPENLRSEVRVYEHFFVIPPVSAGAETLRQLQPLPIDVAMGSPQQDFFELLQSCGEGCFLVVDPFVGRLATVPDKAWNYILAHAQGDIPKRRAKPYLILAENGRFRFLRREASRMHLIMDPMQGNFSVVQVPTTVPPFDYLRIGGDSCRFVDRSALNVVRFDRATRRFRAFTISLDRPRSPA